jgi:competence protein ComEC
MNRPLVAVVVAYGTGLLFALWLHPPLPALAGLFCLLSLLLAVKNARRFLLWPLLALLGWINFSVRSDWIPPHDLRAMAGHLQSAMVTVRGTLSETPRVKITTYDGIEFRHTVTRVRVEAIQMADTFAPAVGQILVTGPVLGPEFFAGQSVEITGVIRPPPEPLAEGMFDYPRYLAARGIHFELRAPDSGAWRVGESHLSQPPLTRRFLDWAQPTLALGLPAEDEPLRLLWAMTLGWRTAFTGDVSDPFLRAGTQHMFAIDGLRIALLSGLIVTLLRALRLARAWCGLIAIPLIWFYTAATGWEPSAVRASVMMTIILGGWVLKRPTDLLNSLAAAALVILLWDPRQMLDAGFQLSFFVMLIIAVTLPALRAATDRVVELALAPDPLLAPSLVPAWRTFLLKWGRHCGRFCALSFAAWLGSLPLAAKYFHLFSPVSTLANLLAVPLGTLALIANLAALICGHWLSPLTCLFNQAAWGLMQAMTWISAEFARLPGAYCYVPEPSLAAIAIYYTVLVAAFSGGFKTARRKTSGAAALLLIAAAFLWQWQASRAETHLTVLPLGGGHAVYVDADGRRNDWLINCGSTNAVNFPLKDYLRGQGVNFVPRLVLADGNTRNCGGAVWVDQLFGVGELWTSGARFRSRDYRDCVAAIEAASHPPGSRHHIFHLGDTNGCWRVLYPAATNGLARAEDAPLVLLGAFPGARILLLSELSRDAQSDLLGRANDLRADLVIAGLPETSQPLSADLIAAIQPRVIIIADSESAPTRYASRALHERLDQTGIPVIYTRTARAVKIVTGPRGWRLQTMDGQHFASNEN